MATGKMCVCDNVFLLVTCLQTHGALKLNHGNTSLHRRSFITCLDSSVQEDTMETGRYGRRGSPWEFNLRDVFRWCELMQREQVDGDAGGDGGACWSPWRVVDTLYIQRMRTLADREAICSRFMEAFPEAAAKIGTYPALRVSPDWVQVGQTVLRRGCWADAVSVEGEGSAAEASLRLPMASALRRPLQALARCVAMRWPALVVGYRGTGKTSLIKGLAAAVGARLTEVAMTPSVDVTELLGCFQQVI